MMADHPWQEAVSEVWELFKETDAKFKEIDAKIAALMGNTNGSKWTFDDDWDPLIELVVRPSMRTVMMEQGIKINFVDKGVRRSHNGDSIEFEFILSNSDTIVIIEAKSHLKNEHIKRFVKKLGYFFDFFPHYRGYKVYAGVAGLTIPDEVGQFAYRRGLFVLQVGGDGMVTLKNNATFKPKDFGQP
jgi:hypothetical protein